ncbi:MAG: hypothetical protein ACKOF3_05185 [Spartobacteria bacterium]
MLGEEFGGFGEVVAVRVDDRLIDLLASLVVIIKRNLVFGNSAPVFMPLPSQQK